MQLIFKDKERRPIQGQENIKFSSFSSLYLFKLTARALSEKQLGPNVTDDEDLTIEIDGKMYPKLENPVRLVNSPAAISGGKSHNLSQTIYLVTFLREGNHLLTLTAENPPGTAKFESLEIYKLETDRGLRIEVKNSAEDGDRRPWLVFVIDNLPLFSFGVSATVRKRYRDSDDLKIVVDGEVKTNFGEIKEKSKESLPREWFYRFWYFAGSILLNKLTVRHFKTGLTKGLHFIEIYADRKPYIESVSLDFSAVESSILSPLIRRYKDERFNTYDGQITQAVVYWNNFFLSQKYPPPEPLDSSLVKALLYVESRMGFGVSSTGHPSFPDIMQVGNQKDPALHVLNNDGTRPTEYEMFSGKEEVLNYRDEAKVNSSYDSIHWGVRWLYHRAQDISVERKPVWYSWRAAVERYGPGRDSYVSSIWNLYKYGNNPEGGETLF